MKSSNYDIYVNGFENGINFGYIPDLNKDEMRIWGKGYNDAKEKRPKLSLVELSVYVKSLPNTIDD